MALLAILAFKLWRRWAVRIAVAGKGGSGKTTVAGTLARALGRRGEAVLAIDADTNPNLAVTLGIPRAQAEQIEGVPQGILHEDRDAAGKKIYRLAVPPDEVIARYGVPAADHTVLLLTGRVHHGGAG